MPILWGDDEGLHSPSILESEGGNLPILPTSIATEEAWGTPRISESEGTLADEGFYSLLPTVFSFQSEEFLDVVPTGIPSSEAWGTPTLEQFNVLSLEALGIASGEAWGIPAILTDDMAQLMINNVEYQWHESTFRISKNLNQPYKASCTIFYFGGPKPSFRQKVQFFWGGKLRFGGFVLDVTEKNIPGEFAASELNVTFVGFGILTDWFVIAKKYTEFLGGIPGIIMYDIWFNYLYKLYGVTKSTPGDEGPSVDVGEILFHYITGTEAINQILDKSPGWNAWIDDYETFHFERTNGIAPNAPFSFVDGLNNLDSIEVTSAGSSSKKRNRQWVLPSKDVRALWQDTYVAVVSGYDDAFPTTYPLDSGDLPRVRLDGDEQLVTAIGTWTPGWQWYYIPGGTGVFPRTPPSSGQVVDILYPNPFPIAFSREDTADIAINGLIEAVEHGKNITTELAAESRAQGLLDLYKGVAGAVGKKVRITYNSIHEIDWLTPGMVIFVDRTFPDINANLTVESVDSAEQELTVWRHTVILRDNAGDVTDSRTIDSLLIAQRGTIVTEIIPATLEYSLDIAGLTNIGWPLGTIKIEYTAQNDGVLASWDATFPFDPPSGGDLVLDCFLNGTSIFPADDLLRIRIPNGETGKVGGTRFVTDNIQIKKGDKLTFTILSDGTTKAKNGVIHVNVKV